MSTSFKYATDLQKEFNYYLGLLSTRFAIVENNVMTLLGKLIIDEVFLINTIIEKNTLSQNLVLLRKLNLYKQFEVESMSDLITKIDHIRTERNLFIHGIWADPTEKEGEVKIHCLETKIVSKVGKYGRSWLSGREHEFKLSQLMNRVEELDQIILHQEELLNKVE